MDCSAPLSVWIGVESRARSCRIAGRGEASVECEPAERRAEVLMPSLGAGVCVVTLERGADDVAAGVITFLPVPTDQMIASVQLQCRRLAVYFQSLRNMNAIPPLSLPFRLLSSHTQELLQVVVFEAVPILSSNLNASQVTSVLESEL